MKRLLYWIVVCSLAGCPWGSSTVLAVGTPATGDPVDTVLEQKQQSLDRLRREHAQKKFRGSKLKTKKMITIASKMSIVFPLLFLPSIFACRFYFLVLDYAIDSVNLTRLITIFVDAICKSCNRCHQKIGGEQKRNPSHFPVIFVIGKQRSKADAKHN